MRGLVALIAPDGSDERLIDIEVDQKQTVASTNYCDIKNDPIDF